MLYRALSAVAPCILGLPLVQLAGAAAKLSARRRDARLSWLRLLGAGRAMLHALVLLEALLQAAIGLLAGLGIYAALIPALGGLHVDGVRIGAAALVLPWWAIALRVAALLGTAGLAAADDRWQVWFGLHRLGMPVAQIDRARRLAVMRPLRVLLVIAVGATVIVLSPMIGAGALISPMTLAAVVVVLGAGAAMHDPDRPAGHEAGTAPSCRRRACGDVSRPRDGGNRLPGLDQDQAPAAAAVQRSKVRPEPAVGSAPAAGDSVGGDGAKPCTGRGAHALRVSPPAHRSHRARDRGAPSGHRTEVLPVDVRGGAAADRGGHLQPREPAHR
ncbi:ABC transporter permease [Kocuria palustris]|uniref:ABC transporter permease n=1 Tax=Kocuria palustris TaxID=71999 RepID=UPI001F297F89|nr:ABC transporter permease [Kocuria palustris]